MQERLGMTAAIMVLTIAGLMVASPFAPPVQAMEASSKERREAAEQLVLEFWKRVWNPPHDLAAVQDLVAEDFVLTSAGTDIQGRDAFAKWIAAFQTKARDLRLEAYETFANAEATRVTSRWRATASNGGMLGTEPMGGRYPSRASRFGRYAGRQKVRGSLITGSSEAIGNCISN